MKETLEDNCEQEVLVEDGAEENVKPDSHPVGKWARLTTLAVGLALASCGASSVPGSSKPETQMPKKEKEASPHLIESAQTIRRLYMGLARLMYVAYHHGEKYRQNGKPQDRQACLKAMSEVNRFFKTMILPMRFRDKEVDSAMRVVKEQTRVKLKLLENNCKSGSPAIFRF